MNLLNRFGLRARVLLTLGCLVLITVGGSLVAIWHTYRMEALITAAIKTNVTSLQIAKDLETALLDQRGYVSYYIMEGNPNWLIELKKHRQRFNERFEDAREIDKTEVARGILNRIESEYGQYTGSKDKVIELYKAGEIEAGAKLHRKVRSRFFNIVELCEEYKDIHRGRLDLAWANSRAQGVRLRLIAMIGLSVVVTVGALLSYVLLIQVLNPIRKLAIDTDRAGGLVKLGDEVAALKSGVYGLLDDVDQAHIELEEERKQLLSMFGSMDEVVYVAAPETYELLYMNEAARQQWGEGIGQKCYRVLQKLDSPCPFCTNDHIFGGHAGRSYIWEFQNKINQHWYRCIDRAIRWPDGRMVRFEMAIDITDRKRAEEQIRILSSKVLEAHEMERKLVAQEIHDSIGASLAAIKYGLEKKLADIGKARSHEANSLEKIIVTVQDTIEESRRISTNLRPSMLDDLGLLPTINWFCREFQSIYSHITVEKQIDIKENMVPEHLKIVIFRILQEAMNNTAKHSGSSLVCLSLGRTESHMELSVEDNGQGFSIEEVLSDKGYTRGIGLASMKDRAELSGGAFQIRATRGTGTSILASWPVGQMKSISSQAPSQWHMR